MVNLILPEKEINSVVTFEYQSYTMSPGFREGLMGEGRTHYTPLLPIQAHVMEGSIGQKSTDESFITDVYLFSEKILAIT